MIEQILAIGLSSKDKEKRISELTRLWPKIESERALFEAAKTDEVASHLAWLLKQSQLDYLSVLWLKEYDEVEKRVTILMDTLEEVATHLKQNSIEIVALKNAGITKGIYQNYACSPMGDIDLLVSTSNFHKAHQLLIEDMGFTFKFRSELDEEDIAEPFQGRRTEYYKKVADHIIWLELQWRPIAGRWIQPHHEPGGDELLRRSISVKNSYVRILAPEDNLLQVALHTAKHSYVRSPGFRLHSDVDRIVRFQIINWDAFLNQVIQFKLKTAVYFSLFFAKELLETPISEDVLKKLKPNWFRKKVVLYYLSKAGLFNQQKKKFSKIGYIIFNLALYDSIFEIKKAIFPPFDTLKMKYNIKSKWQIPYYHLKRIKELLFKRAKL
jgi:hypothetical protein